jgi:hypothetical protein
MNTKPNDGGPAFPQPFDAIVETQNGRELASGWTGMPHPGMSLRAWLAGMAMQGILSSNMALHIDGKHVERNAIIVAVAAREQADAMITELEKESK